MTINYTSEVLTFALSELAWQRAGGVPGIYDIWETSEGHAEVLVPLDRARPDYKRLVSRAVGQFGQAGGELADRALEAALLRSAAFGTQTWHKESPLPSGMIPWSSGTELFKAVSGTLAASAKSAHHARRHHKQSSSPVAKAFLDQVRMGQTQAGSFIVTAHVPLAAQISTKKSGSEALFPDTSELIPADQIVDTLARALDAASSSVEEYRSHARLDAFEEAVTVGVSYELTNALAALTTGGNCEVILERLGDTPTGISTSTFEFRTPDSQVFADAAELLKVPDEPEHVSVLGEVTALRRDHDGFDLIRTIQVRVERPRNLGTVSVQLDSRTYDEAVQAHRDQLLVMIEGTLERRGNRKWIIDPSLRTLLDSAPGIDIGVPSGGDYLPGLDDDAFLLEAPPERQDREDS